MVKAELEAGTSIAPAGVSAAPVDGDTPMIAIETQPAAVGPDAALAELVPVEATLATQRPRARERDGVPLGVWAGALSVSVLILLAWLLRG